MKKLGKMSRRWLALMLICACVFSQVLSVAATGETAEPETTAAESMSETAALPEQGSEEQTTKPSAEAGESSEPETTAAAAETSGAQSEAETAGEEAKTETLPAVEESREEIPVYDDGSRETVPTVEYQTHIQSLGWSQGWVSNGAMAGTEGMYKRLEGILIRVKDTDLTGDVVYQTHVQSFGWQDWKKNGDMAGTEGLYKRLEGIRIYLTGELAEQYDIYYCVHAQTFGWLDWAKNGEMAGTSGFAKRLEGIRIQLVEKGGAAPAPLGNPGRASYEVPGVTYQTHQQTYGTMDWVSDGATAGVTGQSKRMESLAVKLTGVTNMSGSIEYRTHVQSYGWRDWSGSGELNGSVGEAKRMEALQVRLTGELAELYDVYYRLHVQGYGWLGWARNGEMAGTSGLALRVEAIEIKIGAKSAGAPVPLGEAPYHEYTGPGYYRIGAEDRYYSANGTPGGGTGWTRANGNRYYLVNGVPVTGWRYIGGLKYYFNSDGTLCQNVDGIIGPQSSYHIQVNKQANCVTIYAADGANGYIIPVKAMLCSTGDDTPLGTRRTLAKYRWQSMFNGTVAQFATRLTPAPGVLFHSITYSSRNNRALLAEGYNGLGVTRSAGCIRLVCAEAYWIYQRCDVGTLVTVYNDANPGPFDRPVVTPIPADQNWDPTDPTL